MKKKRLLLTVLVVIGLTSASISQNVPSYIPTNGLVGYWPFNGNANDESGNNNNAIVNGPVLTVDRFATPNSAYQFDTTNVTGGITVPAGNPLLECDSALTLSFWLNVADYNRYASFVGKWNHDTNNVQYEYVFAHGPTGLYLYYSFTDIFHGINNPPANQWTHIAMSYDWTGSSVNSICKFYINGVVTDSFAVNQPMVPAGGSIDFGYLHNGYNNVIFGSMDDIAMWNRALTAVEIQQVYESNQSYLDEYHSEALKVYPNPAKSVINVNLDFKLVGANYYVYDVTGRFVLSGSVCSENMIIETSNLMNGLYLLCVGENLKQMFNVIKE